MSRKPPRPQARPPLRDLFHQLLAGFGPQHWWPAETPFEVMVGAVLVQNTAWANVERAIASLRAQGCLELEALRTLPLPALKAAIRPAGYFNVKAQRLTHLCAWLSAAGGVAGAARRDTQTLRQELLAIHGIGPETADAILLYAFGRAVFVIDAYTRRLFARLGWIDGGEPYEALRALFESGLEGDAGLYNEYHALIVQQAKQACRKRPHCEGCLLRAGCAYAAAHSAVVPQAGAR